MVQYDPLRFVAFNVICILILLPYIGVFKPYVPYYQRDGSLNYHHQHFASASAKVAAASQAVNRLVWI